jgi:hypothetical protein
VADDRAKQRQRALLIGSRMAIGEQLPSNLIGRRRKRLQDSREVRSGANFDGDGKRSGTSVIRPCGGGWSDRVSHPERLEEMEPGDELIDGQTSHFRSKRAIYNLQVVG